METSTCMTCLAAFELLLISVDKIWTRERVEFFDECVNDAQGV